MFTENGKGTIFDNVKASKIIKANIPEDEIIKPTKMFTVNNDKFDYDFIVNDYKIPSFKYLDDNSLNDFYEYPDVYMSQNTEYRYKYPHLSTGEYIKQQLQTEAGTPNELNRFMRHEQTGESLSDIKQYDNAYQAGLDEIQKIMKEESEMITNAYNKTTNESKKEKIKEIQTNRQNSYKKEFQNIKNSNPVLIRPAVALQRTTKGNVPTEAEAKSFVRNIYNESSSSNPDLLSIKNLSTKQKKISLAKKILQEKQKAKNSGAEESKTSQADDIDEIAKEIFRKREERLLKEKARKEKEAIVRKNRNINFKNREKKEAVKSVIDDVLDNVDKHIESKEALKPPSKPPSRAPSRSSSPVKSGDGVYESKQTQPDEGYESDKTEVPGMEPITVATHLQPIYVKAQKYLNGEDLKGLVNSVNLKDTNIKAYDKLNKYLAQITGKPSDIKKIGTLRKKLFVQFK